MGCPVPERCRPALCQDQRPTTLGVVRHLHGCRRQYAGGYRSPFDDNSWPQMEAERTRTGGVKQNSISSRTTPEDLVSSVSTSAPEQAFPNNGFPISGRAFSTSLVPVDLVPSSYKNAVFST